MTYVINTLAVIGAVLLVVWTASIYVYLQERRRAETMYDVRKWQESVAALRRMADEEGDA